MTPEIDKVGAAIVKGVCNPEAEDLAVELGEFELDSFLDEGFLKEIPVIKSVIACRKTWTAIHDQLFLRKVAKFLAASPNFTKEEKEAFVQEHLTDSTKAKNLGDTIVLILDRLDDFEKPQMFAKAFARLVRGRIDMETFRRLTAAIDIGFLEDLKALSLHQPNGNEALPKYIANLLRSGLTQIFGLNEQVWELKKQNPPPVRRSYYGVTELGEQFIKCMNE